MPVVVTGADQPLGRAVVAALLRCGGLEIRATVRDRAALAGLVALGVRTAVSDLVDPARFGAVLTGAHTVVHLDGAEPLASLDLLLDAAQDTGLRRLVTVCGPDVEPPEVPYDLVAVRTASRAPTQRLVAALVAADERRDVPHRQIVDLVRTQ